MKKQLLIFILSLNINLFAQDSKINLELNYPLPLGNNFMGVYYNGLIDLGGSYKYGELSFFNLGTSINLSVLNRDFSDEYSERKITSYMVQPKLFVELALESIKKLKPIFGLGYNFILIDNTPSSMTGSETGFNLSLGTKYYISERINFNMIYDFTKLNLADDVPNITFNSDIHILKIGLGYSLK